MENSDCHQTEEGNSVPAFVMNCEFAPVVGKEAMKDAFDAPRLSGKSVSELYGCNVALGHGKRIEWYVSGKWRRDQ